MTCMSLAELKLPFCDIAVAQVLWERRTPHGRGCWSSDSRDLARSPNASLVPRLAWPAIPLPRRALACAAWARSRLRRPQNTPSWLPHVIAEETWGGYSIVSPWLQMQCCSAISSRRQPTGVLLEP